MIAPGQTIREAMPEIKNIALKEDTITIGLNTQLVFNTFLLTTRKDIYDKAIADGDKIIVCSNISKGGRGNVYILNYANWIDVDDRTHDSSSVIALNLLKACGVKNVLLAGFDGFEANINENYYNPDMRHPVSPEQVIRRNNYYKMFINKMKEVGMNISFITPSKYE